MKSFIFLALTAWEVGRGWMNMTKLYSFRDVDPKNDSQFKVISSYN